MGQLEEKDAFRFDDRREYNDGPPNELDERRILYRRENDRYRADVKTALDQNVEDIVTDDEVKKILEPVLESIKNGKYK